MSLGLLKLNISVSACPLTDLKYLNRQLVSRSYVSYFILCNVLQLLFIQKKYTYIFKTSDFLMYFHSFIHSFKHPFMKFIFLGSDQRALSHADYYYIKISLSLQVVLLIWFMPQSPTAVLIKIIIQHMLEDTFLSNRL